MTNVVGMFNVLESPGLLGINMVVYASTNGTFGLDLEGFTLIDDRTLQCPFTMYGCGEDIAGDFPILSGPGVELEGEIQPG